MHSFEKRFKEHQKASQLKNASEQNNTFYKTFPSKDCEDRDIINECQFFFEDLIMYSACGFSIDDDVVLDCISTDRHDSKEKGLFSFGETIRRNILKVNFRGTNSYKEKAIHMIGYLLELAYDLALACSDNMSENPGFETPLGVFCNRLNELLDYVD